MLGECPTSSVLSVRGMETPLINLKGLWSATTSLTTRDCAIGIKYLYRSLDGVLLDPMSTAVARMHLQLLHTNALDPLQRLLWAEQLLDASKPQKELMREMVKACTCPCH